MAIKNERIFGLAVPLSLADIPDNEQALVNLGLDIRDLDVIRGIAAAGFDGNDLQTLSNLDTPIWKTFDRYINDVLSYNTALSRSAGADFRARGNLEVLGPISSSAFRYTLLDTFSTTPELRWGDISTSRVSSWSSIGNSISYGADVKIAGKITTGKLKTRSVPTARTFLSEIPTHRIKIKLNGIDRELLVMKGIPIQFKGFFRDFDCRIDFQSSTVRNSWRVYNTNGTSIQDFADIGSTTSSTLNYRSPFSSEKYIEIYTNPAIITNLALNNCSIQEIPKSRLTALENFSFSNNGLVEFPNLIFFSPNLKILDVTNNPFFNGSDPDQRYFSSKVVSKLPTTLQSLNISGCFRGSFVQNQLNKFTSLTTLSANRSAFNNSSFFYPDSKNPNGDVPNFYGIAGTEVSQVITSINLNDNDFRIISPGIQGGVEFTSLSAGDGGFGGSGYAGGLDATYTNVTLTSGANSTARATIGVSNGVVNLVEITNPGSGYAVGNTLTASNTQLGGTGSGLAIKVMTIINVLSIKEQTKLVSVGLRNNVNLTDSGFSLACPSTLNSIDTYNTKLSIANCSNFTALVTYNNQFNTGRGSLWTGWNGVYGSVGYPETDVTNFKFANCGKLQRQYNDYSDVTGYLPKYVGCPELRSYNFYACNRIIAGRPGKRPIQALFLPGGVSQLGAFISEPGTGSYTFNLTKALVTDTGAQALGASQLATIEVSTDASGNVISYAIVSPGSGYTTANKITILGTQLGATSGKNLVINITTVDPGFTKGADGSATYSNGVYSLTDTRANTAVGRNAIVQVTIVGDTITYSLTAGGQDYQNGESITLSGAAMGGSGGGANSDLRIKIASAQPPKILYNDQFVENTKVTTVNININNPLFVGEIESGAFTPIRDTLSFLRLYANGRIQGNFPNLDDATAIRDVYSNSQGWSGAVPKFTQGFNLTNVYLNNNKFDGTFEYKSKPVLNYVNFNFNSLTSISADTRLPVCRYFYFANNLLSGILPELQTIAPNAEYVQLNSNNYDNYVKGFITLPRIKSLDLSANALPNPVIDKILFDLVTNYNAAPRTGVLVNLQGGRMGAPTPYPVINGIISSLSFTQPTLTNGDITNYGSLDGFTTGSVPIAGTYTNLGLNYRGAPGNGTGANINVAVTVAATDNVATAIGPRTINVVATQGQVKSLGTFVGGGTTGLITGTYDIFDTGTLSAGNVTAQVRVVVASAAGPVTVTLLNGGSNYSKQRGDKIRILSSAWNGPGNMDIDLGTVNEFINGSAVVYTDTGVNSSGNTSGKVAVTTINGVITTTSLDTLPVGGGTGYTTSQAITISLPATGDFNVASNVKFNVTAVKPKWYTNLSLSIAQINSGGSNYAALNTLRTSAGITFQRTNGSNENGFLNLTVAGVTQRTDKGTFTGFGAVEYLRTRGWTVQVNS
jgi:hypothetical protein